MSEEITGLIEAGCWDEADKLAQGTLRNQNDSSGCCQLIAALEKRGELGRALNGLEQLIRSYPQRTSFLLEYARLLVLNGYFEKAITIWQKIIKISPDSSVARFNLAKAYSEIGERIKAVVLYEELLHLHPGHENALFNLANLRQRSGDFDIAIVLYQKLLSCNPLHLEAWINVGKAYKSSELYKKAEYCYRRALELESDSVAAHWNLAHLLLSQERWREGWAEHEWRLQRSEAFFPPALKTAATQAWRGESLFERHILLWVEQGAGDAVQFIRFVPLLPGPPRKITIYCPPRLVRLLATAPGVDQVVSYGQPVPAADFHLSLHSLPYWLDLADDTLFDCVPYLRVVPPAGETVDAELDIDNSDTLKIGLVWAGNPDHANDAARSLKLADFDQFFKISGVTFFSLQVFSEGSGLPADTGLPPSMVDLAPLLDDFAETAGWLHRLDLLITVDTAIAHLAGALGCSAWILLPKEADWRWGYERADSPWYPGVRLFRQRRPGAWGPVIETVARELSALV